MSLIDQMVPTFLIQGYLRNLFCDISTAGLIDPLEKSCVPIPQYQGIDLTLD